MRRLIKFINLRLGIFGGKFLLDFNASNREYFPFVCTHTKGYSAKPNISIKIIYFHKFLTFLQKYYFRSSRQKRTTGNLLRKLWVFVFEESPCESPQKITAQLSIEQTVTKYKFSRKRRRSKRQDLYK